MNRQRIGGREVTAECLNPAAFHGSDEDLGFEVSAYLGELGGLVEDLWLDEPGPVPLEDLRDLAETLVDEARTTGLRLRFVIDGRTVVS